MERRRMHVHGRRSSAGGWSLGLALALAAVATPTPAAPQSSPDQIGRTAAAVLDRLAAGNASFVSSPDGFLPIDIEGRALVDDAPAPMAAVLSCADTRVPPAVIFHAGVGELFVVRSVGHVTDRSILASLEYATQQLEVPLIVVMGHESCGAVRAAIRTPAPTSLGANLDYVVDAIRPALGDARTGDDLAPDDPALRQAILGNVEETINRLIDGSTILRRRAEAGNLAFVGAYFEQTTGRTHFSALVELEPADEAPIP